MFEHATGVKLRVKGGINMEPEVDKPKEDETKSLPIVEQKTVSTEVADTATEDKRSKIISAIDKVGAYLKIPLLKIINCTAFFVVVFLVAWILNGMYNNIHFDLSSLTNFYLLIVGKQAANHTIDSVFNSDRGQPPTNRGK